jgi:hypothetical protein
VKLRWWYGLVFNMILAALGISGAAIYVLYFKGGQNSGKIRTLEIRDTGSGRIYGKWPVETDGEFSVEFIHSVNQSPVRETFVIEGESIRPVRARFFSFGAGMQSDLGEGQTLSRDGDAVIISGFDVSYKELNYIVGTVSDHILFIRDEEISLRNLCGKNAHITIRIK